MGYPLNVIYDVSLYILPYIVQKDQKILKNRHRYPTNQTYVAYLFNDISNIYASHRSTKNTGYTKNIAGKLRVNCFIDSLNIDE